MTTESNTDVRAAIELLSSTLDEERQRIFDAGAQAMTRQDAKTARSVLDFAEKLEGFQQDVSGLLTRWEELQQENDVATPAVQEIITGDGKLFTKVRKTASGFKRNQTTPKAAATSFKVVFPDKRTICEKTAADTFVKTIGIIGSKRVQALGLMLNGESLVMTKPSANYPSASHKTTDGYYVGTHSGTESKIKHLQTISEKLKLGLKVISFEK